MFAQMNRRRAALRRRRQSGFTIVEIMIIVLILGILLMVAVPDFSRVRELSHSKSCVDNLKKIDAAKQQYSLAHKLMSGAPDPGLDALTGSAGASAYLKEKPVCPSNGAYVVNAIGLAPACSVSANVDARYAPHKLPY